MSNKQLRRNNNQVEEKAIEEVYENDNRLGAFILLVSYCGLGLFMFYKTAELIISKL
ncbi:hypothetical protein IX317_001763 [Fusobacterium sp. DD29]|uniref:hypothetical protein n=1 Tax=unclassified Fusobacterium TaxID=2648384 RepID=UPI001B8B78DA|nr:MULTISPECIES: hypothetical protein [unclassified Fusobacterium]MBR8700988.1 hypothetical protein [Fusobacterium sp. DD45]MBR8710759.1 hypothetical protein [Fusobacterium sp. DD28]MBR8750082.1 hypothetical protein [Fusobacterium sp. DD29]MBR8751338.1 hypothetical protein [Fusobacterium sp. DD26]MBR8762311.1 hypothetical protein [Fusobacterium sp. DD25]